MIERHFGLASIDKVFEATTASGAEHEAKADFQVATGYSGDEEGCSCCGQPFYFSVDDENEKPWWVDED